MTHDNLLQLISGSKSFGTKTLFDAAEFAVNAHEHIGVIGPNGAGKSTLFKIILNEEDLDTGQIVRASTLRMGYLAQHDTHAPDEPVASFLEKDSLLPPWELKKEGRPLGLLDEIFERPMASLSGGYRMRVKLLKLISQMPNLMLLDEPTNYLDLETVLVLERFLQSFSGAFLLISHDREFLRRTTDHTLEIESATITKYPGAIDDYFEQKALLREQLERRALSQANKRKEILDFAARFGAKATKARQVQSRLRRLEKMESIEVSPLPVAATIHIPQPPSSGKVSLRTENLAVGYGARTIVDGVQLEILRGDHVAVVGINGVGKSTLLKTLAGHLTPISGRVDLGHNVHCAYYAQHVGEALKPENTVLQCLREEAHQDLSDQAVLDLAGALLFSGDSVKKKVAVLSGGEKARVALGKVLLARRPLLILDEPTNHLDFYTVESLTQALSQFAGTLVIVSHDQGFVRRIATKIIEIKSGQLSTYPGTYEEYVWHLSKEVFVEAGEKTPATPQMGHHEPSNRLHAHSEHQRQKNARKQQEAQIKRQQRKLSQLETDLESARHELEVLQNKLDSAEHPDPDIYAQIGSAEARLSSLEEEWLATMSAIESLNE